MNKKKLTKKFTGTKYSANKFSDQVPKHRPSKPKNYTGPKSHGIAVKKQFGQHFLRDQAIVDHILENVKLESTDSVFEIGCGDGFLTKDILKKPFSRFWIFEIDEHWSNFITEKIKEENNSQKVTVYTQDILSVDFSIFDPYKPWVLLSNLPYQITFPLLYKLIEHIDILKEGIVMVQEEVAQKIVRVTGRGYGFNSLYLQYFFDWKLLDKVSPKAFYPPPRIFSRLLYFKPKKHKQEIKDSVEFWKFIKRAFLNPRRNLKNNLLNYHYDLDKLSEETLQLRAQQLDMADLIDIWNQLLS